MVRANTWNINRAIDVIQVQPRLSKTQPSILRQASLSQQRITAPDAPLFLIVIWLGAMWAIVTFSFFREMSKARLGDLLFANTSKVPCRNCQFFNQNSYLKCAVHPTVAMTEDAIGCVDWCSK